MKQFLSALAVALLGFVAVAQLRPTNAQPSGVLFLPTFNGGFAQATTADIAHYPTSQTVSGRAINAVLTTEKGSRWSAVSSPAAGSQATGDDSADHRDPFSEVSTALIA